MIEIKFGKRKVINYRGAKMVVGGLSAKNKIDILIYIATELSNIADVDHLFDRTVDLATEIFECDNVTLRILENDQLVPRRVLLESDPPKRTLEPNEGFSGASFSQKKPLLIDDSNQYKDLFDRGEQVRSLVCVPLVFRDKAFGTLSIEKNIGYFYKQDDLEILSAMGSQIAMAWDHVHLLKKITEAQKKDQKIQKQLEWDLRMGRKVQEQIVQSNIEPWNGLLFSMYYEPMVEVSGDYLDILRSGENVTVFMADVSGHGVPAALVTVALHYHFRQAPYGLSLIELLEVLEKAAAPILPDGTYFTCQLLRINLDYSFQFLNAGHQKLSWYKKSKKQFVELDTQGFPLGIGAFDNKNYEEYHGVFSPGDLFFSFTDGLVEQKNDLGQEMGFSSVQQCISDYCDQHSNNEIEDHSFSIDQLNKNIIENFTAYSGSQEKGDDIAYLIIEAQDQIPMAEKLYIETKEALKLGNAQAAMNMCKKILALAPSYKDSYKLIAQAYYKKGEYHLALEHLQNYIKTSGEKNPDLYYSIGFLYWRIQEIASAKRSLKQALALNPAFNKASVLLAKCYQKEKNWRKMKSALIQASQNTSASDPYYGSLRKIVQYYNKARKASSQ